MIKYFTLAVLLIFTSYGLKEAWPLISGPTLSIEFPAHDESSKSGIVTITGRATRAAALTLNGAPVLRKEDGSFSTTLTFPRGGSILTFRATDRFGKTVASTRTIFVP
jgi:hypothetical protein